MGINPLSNTKPLRNILRPAKCPAVTFAVMATFFFGERGITTGWPRAVVKND